MVQSPKVSTFFKMSHKLNARYANLADLDVEKALNAIDRDINYLIDKLKEEKLNLKLFLEEIKETREALSPSNLVCLSLYDDFINEIEALCYSFS